MISKKNPVSPDNGLSQPGDRRGERSFSLVETIVAVSLIAFLIVEISGVNGNAINFADYSRKALQASYLAKRIMSQVEYQASWRTPLKDIAADEKDRPFEDAPDFTWSLKVEPMPNSLDLMFKIMSGGLVGGEGKDDEDGGKSGVGAMLEQIKSVIKTAVGDDPIWIAKVSVSWPEGARRSSVDLAMIVTDIKKLETTLTPLLQKGGQQPGVPQVPGALPVNGGGALPTQPPPGQVDPVVP
jgi:type II secretory pathway pseudopilin PulG